MKGGTNKHQSNLAYLCSTGVKDRTRVIFLVLNSIGRNDQLVRVGQVSRSWGEPSNVCLDVTLCTCAYCVSICVCVCMCERWSGVRGGRRREFMYVFMCMYVRGCVDVWMVHVWKVE